MMRSLSSLPVIWGVTTVLISSPVLSASALEPTEIGAIAEEITVLIDGQNPGSGVLIRQEGNVYTLLTAAHVVETEDEYEVITPDNQRYPVDYQQVQKLPGVDLATVRFISSRQYKVAKLGNSDTIKVGTKVYVSGFPMKSLAITERIFSFAPGDVTAHAKQALDDGYALIYTNKTVPGMSGGAVLDATGALVGIHGRADTVKQVAGNREVFVKTDYNLGIPINTFISRSSGKGATFMRRPLPVESSLTADDWYAAAKGKHNGGDYAGAISDYDQAIQLNPDYAIAFNERGIARAERGDSQGAIADLDKAIQLNPDLTVAFFNRGIARYELENYRGAIADYDKAIQLNPDYASAFNNRGNARSNLKDYRGAIADYDKAIQLNPDDALAFYNRGVARRKLEDYRGAIADYDKAIQLNPDYALAFHNRGVARGRLEDYRGAIADLDQAIQLNPDYASAYYNRGYAEDKLGQFQQAIHDFQKAAHLFKQQNQMSNYRKALKELRKLLNK